jgi:predicted enzyme related to lactoylglutathione lyase
MINLRVDDLDAMLAELQAKGVEPEYGKFARILDSDGVKIELWEQAGPSPV